MADSVGNAYITISIDPASAAKVKLEAKALGKELSGNISEGIDQKGGFRRGLKDVEKGLKDVEKGAKDVGKGLKAGEKGLIDFTKIGDKVAKDLNTKFGGRSYGFPFLSSVAAGFFNILGKGAQLFGQVGNAAQKGATDFGKWASEGENASSEMSMLGTTVGSLAPVFGAVALGAFAFGAALLVLPAIVGVVVAVLGTLLFVVTTLTAVFAAFVGPVAVVTGLLGGLGAAFAYVASTVLKANANTDTAKQNLEKLRIAQQAYHESVVQNGKDNLTTKRALVTLQAAQEAYSKSQIGTAIQSANLSGKFDKLVQTLTVRFTPAILDLVSAASQALGFLTKIAGLPLGKAFEELATKGVRQLSKFVYGVANTISKPIRLAIDVAFGVGPGGSTAENTITKWWTSLQHFLFGYAKRNPLLSGDALLSGQRAKDLSPTKQVKGALDPIIEFFNRQHFEKAGKEMANDIVDAFVTDGNKQKIGKFIEQALIYGVKLGAKAAWAIFVWELKIVFVKVPIWIENQLGRVVSWIKSNFGQAWVAAFKLVAGLVAAAASAIKTGLVAAWNAVKTAIGRAWGEVSKLAGIVGGALLSAFNLVSGVVSTIVGAIQTAIGYAQTLASALSSGLGGSAGSGGQGGVPATGKGHTGRVHPATGGLITGGIAGYDSVPALLTPGEIVLNEAMQRNLLGMLYNPPKTGRASGSGVEVHVHNYFGGREMNNLIDTRVDMKQRQTKRAIQAGRTAVA